jgi:hypothetical protein
LLLLKLAIVNAVADMIFDDFAHKAVDGAARSGRLNSISRYQCCRSNKTRARSSSVVGKGRQQGGYEIARPFLDEHLGPLIGSSKSQISVNAVDCGLFDAFDLRLEICLAAGMVHITDNHAQDFLDGDLP